MEKINVAELLKDCPKGMELDCTMFENLYFDYILKPEDLISCYTEYNNIRTSVTLNKYGAYSGIKQSKCVIFPKGKTTWEGFVPPYQFKDGDVVFGNNYTCSYVAIYKSHKSGISFNYSACLTSLGRFRINSFRDNINLRLATEEEKQKLFDAIKENDYKWNPETKTLEKLVTTKFKVGDKIIRKGRKGIDYPIEVLAIENGIYKLPAMSMPIDSQDEWELVSDKFDINTLKIFESRVLVRDNKDEKWKPAIFGGFKKERGAPYIVVGGIWFKYLIPYEGNEHLSLLKNDCDDFYKTWE